MYFGLMLTLDGRDYYGPDHPELFSYDPAVNDPRDVLWEFDETDAQALNDDMIEGRDPLQGTLIGMWDVDHLTARQCPEVIAWIERRLESPCPQRLRRMYEVLRSMCQWAVDLDTGVTVEL